MHDTYRLVDAIAAVEGRLKRAPLDRTLMQGLVDALCEEGAVEEAEDWAAYLAA